MQEYKAYEVEKRDHVAIVKLCGPGKGNALGPDFWEETPRLFNALDADDEVRAILVHGKGDHLTYGLDLPAVSPLFMEFMQAGSVSARQKLHDTVLAWQSGFDAIESCRKPVIAAVHGWCIGGGINMIAACDMRVASEDAKLSLREVKLAITPDLGALQRLPGIIGQGMTRRLAFTGEDISAQRALEVGLVDELFEGRDACVEGALALAMDIAKNSPLVVQGIKQVMNHSLDHQARDGRRYVAAWNAAFLPSNDLMEAVMAFMEKREPNFTGQ